MYDFTKIIKMLKIIKYMLNKEGKQYYESSIVDLSAYISFLEAIHGEEYLDERDPDYPALIDVLEEIEEFILVSKEILGESIE